MIASGELREIKAKIVGKEHGIDATEQERRGPVPPAGEESPEVAESGAHPAIEAALHGHSGSEFGGDERNGDAPEKWDQQVIQQGHAGAGGTDHVFEAEGATGGVGVHDEDEREKSGFADEGLGREWGRSHGGLRRSSLHGERTPPPGFSQVFILKELKVVCFDTDLQVFILKVLSCTKSGQRCRTPEQL